MAKGPHIQRPTSSRNSGTVLAPVLPKEPAIKEPAPEETPSVEPEKAAVAAEAPKELPKATTPAPQRPTVQSAMPAVKTAPGDREAGIIATCLDNYKRLLSKPRASVNDQVKAASYLVQAIRTMIQNPRTELFDLYYGFMQDNINGVCSERTALQGITKASKDDARVVMCVVDSFRYAITKAGRKPNESTLFQTTRCQRLLAYLNTKR